MSNRKILKIASRAKSVQVFSDVFYDKAKRVIDLWVDYDGMDFELLDLLRKCVKMEWLNNKIKKIWTTKLSKI